MKSHLLSRRFAAQLIVLPWSWMRYVPPKRRFPFSGIHGIISEKIIYICTSVLSDSIPKYLRGVLWCGRVIFFLKERKLLKLIQKLLRKVLKPNTLCDWLTTCTKWWRERSMTDKDHLSCYFSKTYSREFATCQTGSPVGRNMKRAQNIDGGNLFESKYLKTPCFYKVVCDELA
jgi:hypothetical protein